MDDTTIRQLNALNRAFYATTADEFDATRGQAWAGWTLLLPYLSTFDRTQPLRVLDVGCGNGRFGLFLAQHWPQIAYHGVDNSAALLAHAQRDLAPVANLTATLSEWDIVEQPVLEVPPAQLVALFGVLHHIPGAAQRRALVRHLAGRVAPGGILVFAAWRFAEFERFRERIIPWETYAARHPELAPDLRQLEAGDYLLDWRRGAQAVRYCHAVDDAEQAALAAATGLEERGHFRADGEQGRANAYTVLQRMG